MAAGSREEFVGPLKWRCFGVGRLRPHSTSGVFLSQPVVKGAAEMLKRCTRPLFMLVLALVAMGVFSSIGSARDLSSVRSSEVEAAGSLRQPTALTGDPDTPLAPPPASGPGGHSGSPSPQTEDESPVDVIEALRWIGLIFGFWLRGAAF